MATGEEVAEVRPQRYHQRFVSAVLACAWLAVICAIIGTGLMLLVDGLTAAAVLMLLIVTLMFLAIPASVAVLVMSVVGGMWNRWVDGIITAALLLVTLSADLVFWPLAASQTNIDFASLGGCMAGGGGCSTGSDTEFWVGVGIQILILVALLVCTSHWMWRLNPQTSKRRSQTIALVALAVAGAGILAAIDLNIPAGPNLQRQFADYNGGSGWFAYSPTDTGPGSGPTGGPTTLVNDLGHPARVVYCPLQNCAGQPARTIASGASASFPDKSTMTDPDSFVILGSPPLCQTVDGPGGDTMPLSSADAQTCGMDVQTLTVH